LKEVVDRFELTNGCLTGVTTDNASSNHSMTYELQSSLDVSTMEMPALGYHIPCTAHVVQLAHGLFMSCLGVEGCTNVLENHEHSQQCADIESN
jgi:hypothetical protein